MVEMVTMPEPFRSVCGRCRVCGGVLRKHDGQVHGGPFVSHRPQWFPFDVGQLGRGGDRAPHLCDRVHLVTCSGCSPGGIPLTGLGGGRFTTTSSIACVPATHNSTHALCLADPRHQAGAEVVAVGGPGVAGQCLQCNVGMHPTPQSEHHTRTTASGCAHARARPHAHVTPAHALTHAFSRMRRQ
jgi:hypothetical protein